MGEVRHRTHVQGGNGPGVPPAAQLPDPPPHGPGHSNRAGAAAARGRRGDAVGVRAHACAPAWSPPVRCSMLAQCSSAPVCMWWRGCVRRRNLDANVPAEEADRGWAERTVVGGLSLSAIAVWCAGLRQRKHWVFSGPSTLLRWFSTEVIGILRVMLALSPGLILALQVGCGRVQRVISCPAVADLPPPLPPPSGVLPRVRGPHGVRERNTVHGRPLFRGHRRQHSVLVHGR